MVEHISLFFIVDLFIDPSLIFTQLYANYHSPSRTALATLIDRHLPRLVDHTHSINKEIRQRPFKLCLRGSL